MRKRDGAKSLRSRWSRAFVGLTIALVVGGAVSVVGTQLLVGSYRGTAHRLETETALLSQLRADLASYAAVTATGGGTAADRGEQARLDVSIRAGFERGATLVYAPAGRAQLRQGYAQWRALVGALRVLDPKTAVGERGVVGLIATDAPRVLLSIDRAGAASLVAARADLAKNAAVERVTYGGLAVVVLLMVALMIRLARRLSVEVLRPVGQLRTAANLLAAGDLGHRALVSRDDELGDLASAFNAMADAIAGSQQTLTLQANHDSLTGLANRAGFRARAQEVLGRPDRRC